MKTDPSAVFCNFPRLSARSIKDFGIPPDAINPDAELAKRAEDSAMELSRLSLIGIAGYGFLLKEMAMANSSGLLACQRYAWFILAGALLLGVATALALYTRELSIRSSFLQINILRTIVKLENGGWSAGQDTTLNEDLQNYRANQKDKLNKARYCLLIAHLALALGTILTVTSYGLVLFALKPEPRKQSQDLLEQSRHRIVLACSRSAGVNLGWSAQHVFMSTDIRVGLASKNAFGTVCHSERIIGNNNAPLTELVVLEGTVPLTDIFC